MVKEKTVCFTGHRPAKLITDGAVPGKVLPVIKSMLYCEIQQAVEDGYQYFISGMAQGVDLWAAQYVLIMRQKYPRIQLICAVPFKGQGDRLHGVDMYNYRSVINSADEMIILSDRYDSECFKRRNYYMVDNSSRLIAVVSNYHSGTGQTINYARKNKLDIRMIDAKKCCETQMLADHSNDPSN